MIRAHGLVAAELAQIGPDADALRGAIHAAFDRVRERCRYAPDPHLSDARVHQELDAVLSTLPAGAPETEAVRRSFDLLRAIIDAGESDWRSVHELVHWIDGDGPLGYLPGLRPATW